MQWRLLNEACNQHLYLVPQYFMTSKGKPIPVNQLLSIPCSPHALETINLCSIFYGFTSSYKWNHTIRDLLCGFFHLAQQF